MSPHYLVKRIVAVWEAVDQRVIDAAIRQWQECLLASVKAKEEHYEHLLKYIWARSHIAFGHAMTKMHGLIFLNTVNFVGFSVIHVSHGSVATYVRYCGTST